MIRRIATILKLGPADHDLPIGLEDFESADYREGFKYEIIDGRLYVSPLPNLPEDYVEKWLYTKVALYSRRHRDIINYVTDKARVFVPQRPAATIPEPDLAAYDDFPIHLPIRRMRWQDVSPFLVGEVLSADDPNKDLIRNVDLYLLVPTIKEYWVVDAREDPDRPSLKVYRRRGKKWHPLEVGFGETYTTKLLPGFRLVIDPRK